MTTIGLIGAGHIGSQVARLAVRNGYKVVISNSRDPKTLSGLVAELGLMPALQLRSKRHRPETSSW